MSATLRIATRKSRLALWQANHVRGLLEVRHPGIEIELVPLVTQGDRMVERPLAAIGGKGLFLKELEQALLADRADFAVHSMKDVPATDTPGLTLHAVLERANPFDAWVSRDGRALEDLPAGARVGTSSQRRQCQLRSLRPDLCLADLRGNVDTRLARLDEGAYEAVILACAGLERLGFADRICHELRPPDWLPAPTQGIIALQCREDDHDTQKLLEPLADTCSHLQALGERAVARVLEGSCQVPLAAYADLEGDRVSIEALVGTPDGRRVIRAREQGEARQADLVGERVARRLLNEGAGEIIRSLAASGTT